MRRLGNRHARAVILHLNMIEQSGMCASRAYFFQRLAQHLNRALHFLLDVFQMDLVNPQKNIEQKMQRSIEVLSEALKKIRTGRAHTGLLDHVQVEYYGARVPISQAANLTLMDARTIGVMPWDKKIMPVIEKAIRESDLGLNPSAQGDFLRVPMPPLTEE